MIRVWIGVEHEAIGSDLNKWTIFFCADEVMQGSKVIEILSKYKNIKRAYFGAGRTPFYGVDGWEDVVDYCLFNGVAIFIEVQADNISKIVDLCGRTNTTYILTLYNAPKHIGLYCKTDDTDTVKLYYVGQVVDVTTVKGNRYLSDIVVYEEGC